MPQINTKKLDELFSALIDNDPLTTDQIRQAEKEYHKLRDIAGNPGGDQANLEFSRTGSKTDGRKSELQSICPHCKESLHESYPLAETQEENNRLRKELHLKINMCRDLEDKIRRLKHSSSVEYGNTQKSLHSIDPVRKEKLAEQYTNLFNNEWLSTYKHMDNHLNMREDKILDTLLRILRAAFKFCEDISQSQIKNMEGEMYCPLSTWTEDRRIEYVSSRTGLPKTITNLAKQYRQSVSRECIPSLQKAFELHILPEFVEINPVDETVATYAKCCVEITWCMCIQDPPMNLVSKVNRKANFDPNLFRHYSKVGDKYDFVVWPALVLLRSGHVVCKGVAQAFDNSRFDLMQSSRSQDYSPRKTTPRNISPLAVLRGTTWDSQPSVRYTPSVELPLFADEDQRVDSPNQEKSLEQKNQNAPLPMTTETPSESKQHASQRNASKQSNKETTNENQEARSSFLGNSNGRLTAAWKYPTENSSREKAK